MQRKNAAFPNGRCAILNHSQIMRPFKFFFGLLFVAAAAFVLLKLLFFAAFAALIVGGVFFATRRFRRFGPGYRHYSWPPGYAASQHNGDFTGRPDADALDPRQPRRKGEPLAGYRTIEIL